jgi:hypothetical protein
LGRLHTLGNDHHGHSTISQLYSNTLITILWYLPTPTDSSKSATIHTLPHDKHFPRLCQVCLLRKVGWVRKVTVHLGCVGIVAPSFF